MRSIFYHSEPDWSGSARAFAVAARALAERGWQVTLVVARDGEVQRRLTAAGLEVVGLPRDAHWMTASRRLAQVVREGFVEVVFVHGEQEHLVAAMALRQAKRGAVVRRTAAGGRLALGRASRFAMRLAATGLLFTSERELEATPPELQSLDPVVADLGLELGVESRLTPPGTPVVAAEPVREFAGDHATGPHLGDGEGLRRLVCSYEPSAKRRVGNVLRTVAMLAPRHPELRVALVGQGSDDEDLRMHAAALGINRIVTHLGQRDDLPQLVAAADVGWVIADLDDAAFGVLDFMAARVPVVAERATVAERYVADGISGVLLPADDVPICAAAVAALLARDDERRAMGNAGRSRVMRAFTEAAMVDGFARAATAARDRTRWRT